MCAWQQGGLLQKFQELLFLVDDLPIGKLWKNLNFIGLWMIQRMSKDSFESLIEAEDLRFQLSFYYSPSSTYNLTDADLNIEGLQV